MWAFLSDGLLSFTNYKLLQQMLSLVYSRNNRMDLDISYSLSEHLLNKTMNKKDG